MLPLDKGMHVDKPQRGGGREAPVHLPWPVWEGKKEAGRRRGKSDLCTLTTLLQDEDYAALYETHA